MSTLLYMLACKAKWEEYVLLGLCLTGCFLFSGSSSMLNERARNQRKLTTCEIIEYSLVLCILSNTRLGIVVYSKTCPLLAICGLRHCSLFMFLKFGFTLYAIDFQILEAGEFYLICLVLAPWIESVAPFVMIILCCNYDV